MFVSAESVDTLMDRIFSDGGFTVRATGDGAVQTVGTGYAVGGVPRFPSVSLPAERGLYLRTALDAWVHMVTVIDAGAVMGAWVDDGRVHLDVITLMDHESSALHLARDRGEQAVFNLSTGQTVYA